LAPAPEACCLNGLHGMEPLWSSVVATGGNQWQIGRAPKPRKQAKSVAMRCHRLPEKFHGKQGVCRGLPPVAGGPLPEKEGVDPPPIERWIQAGANSGHSLLHNHARSAIRARVYRHSIPDSPSRSAPATRPAPSTGRRAPILGTSLPLTVARSHSLHRV